MKRAVIVAGMAYGDEAKGATVDFLCRDLGASLVVRYNGGHQAAHNVVLEDGRHHTFSQFGSGSFIPGVRTHLSRFMLINPGAMLREEGHLKRVGMTEMWRRTTIDERCVVVTPYHRAFNRLEEIHRGHRAHGSCGVGIGVARRLELSGTALRAKDLYRIETDRTGLGAIKMRLRDELEAFRYTLPATPEVQAELDWFYDDAEMQNELVSEYKHWAGRARLVSKFTPADVMIFEGAQGVLLDETHGTAPYNTWTNTTFENAFTLLGEADFQGEVTRLGCFRSYFTRHGYGPLWNELSWPQKDFTGSPRWPELHNTQGRYQGNWRVAYFDHQAAMRAVKICGGIDEISISHMDYAHDASVHTTPDFLAKTLDVPVTILSYGPTAKDRKKCPDSSRNRAQDVPSMRTA